MTLLNRHAPAIAYALTSALAALALGTWLFLTSTPTGVAAIAAEPARYVFTLLLTYLGLLLAGAIPFALLRRRTADTPTLTSAALGASALCCGALLALGVTANTLPSAYEFGLTAFAGAGLGALYRTLEAWLRPPVPDKPHAR